ncbi:glycosyl transferase [Fibrobacteria bacterium R8-3-H12]
MEYICHLYQKLENYNSVIVFGAGSVGKLIGAEIKLYCEETGKSLIFADNSHEKWNKENNIMPPVEAVSKFPNALWIVSSDIYGQSMLEDLRKLGVKDENIIKKPPAEAIVKWQIIVNAKRELKRNESKMYIEKLLSSNKNIMLEVGAGEKKGDNGWTTLDINNKCDIYWDLRDGIPFPKDSVSKIYSSHFLEHLTFRECQIFLQECLRVLVPNGIFSICVPNARIYIEAYIKNEKLDDSKFYISGFNNTTKIDYVNYMAYMDGHHKYMFDEENILCILAKAGFREVKLRCFDNLLDLEGRNFESIYAEAIK